MKDNETTGVMAEMYGSFTLPSCEFGEQGNSLVTQYVIGWSSIESHNESTNHLTNHGLSRDVTVKRGESRSATAFERKIQKLERVIDKLPKITCTNSKEFGGNKMTEILKKSCKGSNCIAYCEQLIDEIDPHQDLSRPGKFNRAIAKAINNSLDDWAILAKELKKFKNDIPEEINIPTALQMKVEDILVDDLLQIEENIKKSLNLSTLQTRYEVEILEYNYLQKLKKEVLNVGEKDTSDLNGPEMVKRLVQILLLNRNADKPVIEKVKTALLEWKE